MTELTTNFAADQALELLTGYGFELKGYPASILVYKWLNHYRASWIRLAVVEALYLGRYKAISVEHILAGWLRRGQPNFHFSHEFERLICETFARDKALSPNSQRKTPAAKSTPASPLGEATAAAPLLPSLASETAALPELKETTTGVAPGSAISEVPPTLPEAGEKGTDNPRTIEQFTPLLDNSELYSKLRAVAHRELDSHHSIAASGK